MFGWVDNYLVESAEKVSPLGLVKSISMMLRYEFNLPIEAGKAYTRAIRWGGISLCLYIDLSIERVYVSRFQI